MAHNTLQSSAVAIEDLQQVEQLAQDLPQGSAVAVMLQNIVNAAQRGMDISMFTSERELTPNEAAELLRVSRAHLTKLMDRQIIEFHRVGTHRRLKMSSLMDYIDRQERARAFVAHAVGTTNHDRVAVMDEASEFTSEELKELGLPA
jgi:excisionase family DNA binding protein